MEPITFITGTPGAGKTLYAVTFIEKERIARQLAVFYHGIPELKLGWTQLEKPEDWHQVVGPALVAIDEASSARSTRRSTSGRNSAPPRTTTRYKKR